MKRRNSEKKRNAISSILSSWYGEERGEVEVAGHLPCASELRFELSRLMEKSFTAERHKLADLAANWAAVVGESVARCSRPCSLKDKTLFVEVFRSVFIRELSIPQTKQMMIRRINEHLGGESCGDVRFVPYGRRP